MRTVLTMIAVSMSVLAMCQCKYSMNEVDPFTKNKMTRTELSKAKATSPGRSLYVSAVTSSDSMLSHTYLTLALMPSPKGCVSGDSKVIFLWPDGGTETIDHVGKVNCSTPAHLLPIQDDSRLLTEQPSAVRLYFSDGYLDVTLTGDDITRHLECAKNPS